MRTARPRLAASVSRATGSIGCRRSRRSSPRRRHPRRSPRQRSAAAMSALGADAAGLTTRTDEDPDTLRVLAASTQDDGVVSGWRRHPIDTPAPGPEIVRTGRPIFIETRRELLARFPLVTKIEKDQRFGGFAGVPVPLGAEVLGALSLASTATTWCPRRSEGSSYRWPIRQRSHFAASVRGTMSVARGRRPSTRRTAYGSSKR